MAQAMLSQDDGALEATLKLKRDDQVRLVHIVAELGEVAILKRQRSTTR